MVKNLPANRGDARDTGPIPVSRIPWSRKWQPPSVFSPEKYHGQRNLVGYSPWGLEELILLSTIKSICVVLSLQI